ncbi:hypothetical protein ISTM_166 [Insectomime virus]|uniref:MORN repeat-containing protein n=1 Tax=Tunisvirus fontaine2 TaxID=1421067 RepID=V9SGI0_9VIRU|nr:hypothetical protein D1R32_gp155 [Tunisvirus fontaine2]AHA46064.1 hypothetical protein ISTM_166 [Insectomime virus]AHC54872.1 hypothetical protein TNS_ORF154 [Tunisvirus fontaine2]
MENIKFLEKHTSFLSSLPYDFSPQIFGGTKKFVSYGIPGSTRTFRKRKNKVFSCEYKGQNRHGEELVFLHDKLYQRVEWHCGAKDGKETTYYDDGKKLSEGNWQTGRRVGTWTYWYAGENKRKEDVWYFDEIIKTSTWNRRGKLMYSCEFRWGRKHGTEKKWINYRQGYDLTKYDNGRIFSTEYIQR